LDGEDSSRGWHFEDQIPVIGDGHEPVQGQSANDGVEGEVDFCNIKDDVLRAEVFLSSECNRECNAPKGIHRLWAHSGEWARGSQSGLRDLQPLERSMADDVEACPAVNQHMVQSHVSDDRGGDERQYAGPCHVIGAVGRPEGDDGAPPSLVGSSLRDPWSYRQDLKSQGLDIPAGGKFPASVVHDVQFLTAVSIISGVGISSEDIFEVLLRRLIPEFLISRSHLIVVDPLLAKPITGRGAAPGWLLAPLTDALCEPDDLAAFRGAVVSVGMHGAQAVVAPLWPGALIAFAPPPSRGCDSRSGNLQPLIAAVLLLFIVPGDGIRPDSSGLWNRVPCTALGSPGAFVGQSKEYGDSLHVVCGQLF
jgi:hypothetical protein